jgi:hypothetical protein
MSGTQDNNYANKLREKHERIKTDLAELMVIETHLFNQLDSVDKSSASATSTENRIKQNINSITNVRTRLLEDLKGVYTNARSDLNLNMGHLQNQTTMSNQLKEELKKAEDTLKQLKAEKNNKTRLAQIGEYEFAKNVEHKGILKTIVYGSLIILLLFFLSKKKILPEMITQILVITTTSVIILLIVQRLYWNFRRNNIDYSKFSQPNLALPVGKKRKASEFKLSELLGLKCDADLNAIAKQAALKKASSQADGSAENNEAFTNYNTVFPSQLSGTLNYSSI